MSTYKELIYIVSDLAKQMSDDVSVTNRHIAFLLNKYRTYLLRQKYLNKTQEIPLSNYQTICTTLQLVPAMTGCTYNQCMEGDNSPLLRSKEKVELPLTFSDTKVSIFKCPGLFSLSLNIKNKWLSEEQVKYINNLFGKNIIELYEDDPESWETNDNIIWYKDVFKYYDTTFDDTTYDYVDFGGDMPLTIELQYNIETKEYKVVARDIDLSWSLREEPMHPEQGEKKQDYKKRLYDRLPEFLVYAVSCKDDALTLIDLLDRQGISATLESLLSIYGPCDEETFYTTATRRFNNITVVDRNRFNYVGMGKYHRKAGYATIGIDNYLYIKSEQDLTNFATDATLGKALVTAIFENPDKAYEQSSCVYRDADNKEVHCPTADENGNCDPWEREFPIEDALQTQLINLVLRDILGAAYRPADKFNSADDELNDIATFIRQNMKKGYNAKHLDNDTDED